MSWNKTGSSFSRFDTFIHFSTTHLRELSRREKSYGKRGTLIVGVERTNYFNSFRRISTHAGRMSPIVIIFKRLANACRPNTYSKRERPQCSMCFLKIFLDENRVHQIPLLLKVSNFEKNVQLPPFLVSPTRKNDQSF